MICPFSIRPLFSLLSVTIFICHDTFFLFIIILLFSSCPFLFFYFFGCSSSITSSSPSPSLSSFSPSLSSLPFFISPSISSLLSLSLHPSLPSSSSNFFQSSSSSFSSFTFSLPPLPLPYPYFPLPPLYFPLILPILIINIIVIIINRFLYLFFYLQRRQVLAAERFRAPFWRQAGVTELGHARLTNVGLWWSCSVTRVALVSRRRPEALYSSLKAQKENIYLRSSRVWGLMKLGLLYKHVQTKFRNVRKYANNGGTRTHHKLE